MRTGLALEGLTKTYPTPDGASRFVVMQDFTLTLEPGEFVCLVGHSGCGKSTALSIAAGLNSADAGHVTVNGAVVNGPNDAELFAEGVDEPFDEANDCPIDGKDRYAAFTGQGSRFVDDVSAWQTVEPALDFTAIAAYALALSR